MQRYVALDAFRGLTIALMILVNTPGSWSYVYAPLLHSHWHGVTPTDLVFPFFMFIVGSAMFFAFRKDQFTLSAPLAKKIIKRSGLIFIIGLLLNIYPFIAPMESWRVMGVLQRIGIAYGFAAFIVLSFQRAKVIVIALLILVAYPLLLMLAGDGAYRLETNLVRDLDLYLLGASHMYRGLGVAFDPEGILSTLPSIVSVLIGFEVTRFISQMTDKKASLIKLIVLAMAGLIIGLIMDSFIPINKSLWTSSYVIYSAGFACLTLALFVFVIDIQKIQQPVTPLLIYGTNPLFIYVLSWLWVASYSLFDVANVPLNQWMFNSLAALMPEKLASFVFALMHVVLFGWFSKLLFDRKIFIKI
ncbi:membrane protein [Thalassotalea insulae]|uniref:Membrane protein n=1 Tax=Thalassotalea insulae TaxID=2056778 RepID=A0ABQ6GS63_9GAMM|nr:heparan-alpha-glucosaminide N-acetyltransferase domain-containing protein [Thalassotalea insulae]GLX78795.1 membrane protein [Thalassotalea insulae]